MKASINLKIYDDSDEVIEEFEATRVRWGFLEDVIEINEEIEGKSAKEQFQMMGKMLQLLFPKLTDELLRKADFEDVQRCFIQIRNIANKIEGADSKNV